MRLSPLYRLLGSGYAGFVQIGHEAYLKKRRPAQYNPVSRVYKDIPVQVRINNASR